MNARCPTATALPGVHVLAVILLCLLLSPAFAVLPAHCPDTVFDDLVDDYLRPFNQTGILSEDLDRAETHVYGSWAFRVKIIDNIVYYKALTNTTWPDKRFYFPMAMLQLAACEYYLPDLDLVLQMEDYGVVDLFANGSILPIFSYAKNAATGADILFPNPFGFLRNEPGTFKGAPAWDKRLPKAIFRGSTTGHYSINTSNWHTSPRGQLVLQCSRARHLCDGGFTAVVQAANPAAVWSAISAANCSAANLPMAQWARYKYILMADGNGPSASRFHKLMLSGSPLVKQSSPNVEFFYTKLKPFEHYIPLSTQSLDLPQVLRWARDHDGAAYQIGQNALRFARQHLGMGVVRCFLARLLQRYAALQTFFPRLTQRQGEFAPWFPELQEDFMADFAKSTGGRCPPLVPHAPSGMFKSKAAALD